MFCAYFPFDFRRSKNTDCATHGLFETIRVEFELFSRGPKCDVLGGSKITSHYFHSKFCSLSGGYHDSPSRGTDTTTALRMGA